MVGIDWEEHGLVRRLSGTVTTEELDASAKAIQSHARLDEMRYNIHDFTAVTEVRASRDDLEFMAARASVSLRRNPRIRIAFVGTHPVVRQLIAAFHDSGCSQHRIRRFDTLAEARAYAEE